MRNQTAVSPGALDGVRVLDLTAYVAGPYATRLMADMGAEIIKVEPPSGDYMRSGVPRRGGKGTYFAQVNAGKKSVAIDLTKPEGIDLFFRLLDISDVVIENYRPGVMQRYGLDYATLRNRKPDIIYCSVSGYGQEGPASGLSAYAPIIHAASGWELSKKSYEPALEKPMRNNDATADFMGATHAMGAICAALFRRERTGEGERLDIAMMDVMHSVLAFEYQEAQFPPKRGRPSFIPVATKDGFILVVPLSLKNYDDLLAAIGHPEWKEKYPLNTQGHFKAWEELMAGLEEWAADYTAIEAEAIISAGGCPVTRFLTMEESMNQPQVAYRGAQVEMRDDVGPFKVPNTPMRTTNSESRLRPEIAEIGQHNEEILRDMLKLADTEIDALYAQKVLHKKP
ncbi:MAG TPA: carnitine dehydratase [Alphaproteobacteria bacterium]|nr:carnitine dehydratase [Alphaproteobacteria bacterium]